MSEQGQEDKPPAEGATGGSEEEAAPKEEKKKKSLLDSHPPQTTTEWLRGYFSKALGISNEPPPEKFLEELSLEAVAKYIKSDKCQKIVTMAGAGISTSAGIPDFRSPGTGLYDNLQKYDLPNPQSVFDIDYFKENPEPFFMLAKELYPGSFKPTPCHYFIKLLSDKKKLLRHFTQNIDTLERVAGVPDDQLVEAHGTFHSSHCIECKRLYTLDWMKEKIFKDEIPKCEDSDCGKLVKPDIVFFGESLPEKFVTSVPDLGECDLLIVLGTSLVVQPFASLTSRVKDTTPRLYINMEKTGSGNDDPMMVLMFGGGFQFDSEDNYRDVFWQGKADDGCYALAEFLGWKDILVKMVKEGHAKVDAQLTKGQKAAAGKGKGTTLTPKKSPTPSKTTATKKTSGEASPAKQTPSKSKPSPAAGKKDGKKPSPNGGKKT